MNSFIEQLKHLFNRYFDLSEDKDDEQEVIDNITKGIAFRGANLWVLMLAILIASLGLNMNSTAVIIGAMLISPLMGPILGMGLALGTFDVPLLKRSASNYAVATVVSIVTATLYFLLTPFHGNESELLARTSPTIYDVLIAFCGGMAGIIALTTGGKDSNVIPGVAIATALMPPLCTAGYGIASGSVPYFLGAFYLFFINTVFIGLATAIGVRRMHFKVKEFAKESNYKKARNYVSIAIIVILIPSFVMTYRIVRQSLFENRMQQFIEEEMTFRGTEIVNSVVNKDSMEIQLVAVGKEIKPEAIESAQQKMDEYRLGAYRLHVIQGSQYDSLMLLNDKLKTEKNSNADYSKSIQMKSEEIAALKVRLYDYSRYDDLSHEIANELQTLYPSVRTFTLANANMERADTALSTRMVTAIVGIASKPVISNDERQNMRRWLQTRAKCDTIRMVFVSDKD